jgi:hypothetical protein
MTTFLLHHPYLGLVYTAFICITIISTANVIFEKKNNEENEDK